MLIDAIRAARVGIVGAGMAGLSCADQLVAQGHMVQLFDKGRGPGGRMSTRRMETATGDVFFDHGAQYFTARDAGFLAVVAQWARKGVAARWAVAGADAWVGVPGMNAVIKDMAERHDVAFNQQIKGLVREGQEWHLMTGDGSHGPFDAVIVAVPAEQAAPLLALHDLALAQQAMHARSQPCWTVMLAFDQPLPVIDDVFRDLGPISWAARNSAKPGRFGPEAWVVQASCDWSIAHLESDKDQVLVALCADFERAIGAALPKPVAVSAHRWRFALSAGMDLGALWNADINLGVCADWLLGPRVECAWLSGKMLAGMILAMEGQSRPQAAAGEGLHGQSYLASVTG